MGEIMNTLDGKRIAILATDGVERVELQQPRDAVVAAGAAVEVISLERGEIRLVDGDLTPAGTAAVDAVVTDVSADDYHGLILPGGTVNADRLRTSTDVRAFVAAMLVAGKPVGAICHAPWVLIDTEVVAGQTVTSHPSVRTDLRNAGANPVDEQVARAGNLVTSRTPGDLPAFCAAITELFATVTPIFPVAESA
jgi:protease I